MVCVRCNKGITSEDSNSGNTDCREDKIGLYFFHKNCKKATQNKKFFQIKNASEVNKC